MEIIGINMAARKASVVLDFDEITALMWDMKQCGMEFSGSDAGSSDCVNDTLIVQLEELHTTLSR
jgi:hypothetical protein